MYSKDKQICDEARKREVEYGNLIRVARQDTEIHIQAVDNYLGDYNNCMRGCVNWLDNRDGRLHEDCKRDLA